MTVRQVPDVADTGPGDAEGGAAAEGEVVGEALGTSIGVGDWVLGDGSAVGPNAVGAGPLDPGVGASTGGAPPHAATISEIVARAPTNFVPVRVPARQATIRRDRIEGL